MVIFKPPNPNGFIEIIFAWLPIKLEDGSVVWLERVYRETRYGTFTGRFLYYNYYRIKQT